MKIKLVVTNKLYTKKVPKIVKITEKVVYILFIISSIPYFMKSYTMTIDL